MKKILSLLLSLSMVFSTAFIVMAEDIVENQSSEISEFLKMLGVADLDNEAESDGISRAEFAHLLMKAMNQNGTIPTPDVFSDVKSTSLYAGDISRANALGLINGDVGGVFRPDDPITSDAALKMTILALGYNDIAAAYGGYPTGYLRVANELDLIDGVNISNEFNADSVYQLIFNFLNTDICMVSSVVEGSMTLKRDFGNTPLTHWFDLEMNDGIIKTAGFVSMLEGFDSQESTVYINGSIYKADVENIEKYLGKNASVWYDESNCVRAIYVNEDNYTTSSKSENIDRKHGNTLYIYDEEKDTEKKVVLDPSYTFVKNGRCINPSESDFYADGADITFIDNNSDNRYDVLISRVPEYMVVSYINAVDGIVFDTSGSGKQLVLDTESGVHYTITTTDKDGTTISMYMEDLASGDVIKYYISNDSKYVEAEMCRKTVSGSVSETYEDKVVIDGNEYKLNSYFGSPEKINFGVQYTFLLASDNTITAVASAKSGDMKYGFLVNFKVQNQGLDNRAIIGILKPDNELLEAELASKIAFDDNQNCKSDSDIISGALKNGENTICQIIRYSIDSDGKVDKIDTAKNLPVAEYGYDKLIDGSSAGSDSLIRHLHQTDVYYISETNTFTPTAVIGGSTIFISVPTDFDETGATAYDEDNFSFITTSDLGRYGAMNLTMYDINKSYEPGVVMVYNGIVKKNPTVRNDSSPAVVKDVTRGFNAEGDSVYVLSLYRGKSAYKLPLSTQKSQEVDSGVVALPSSGDIIRYATDAEGEIANYIVDVKYVPASGANKASLARSGVSGALGRALSNYAMHFGKSYFTSSTSIALTIESGMESAYTYFDNVAVFKTSSPNVIVYNHKAKTARTGNINMLKCAVATGENEASLIAVKCYDNRVTDVIIYE